VISIRPGLDIPESEIRFVASRSSGPGGQHVNKASTRVTLLFDVARSPSLRDDERRRIAARLGSRMNAQGVLRVTSQRSRSREANEQAAVLRFAELLREALHRDPPRAPTRATRASKERRISEKKARSRVKERRGRPGAEE
jgi:ribosome-associated protein